MDPVFVDPVIPAETGISRVVPVESSVHVDMITVPGLMVPELSSDPVLIEPVSVYPVFVVPVIPAEAGISVPVFVTHGSVHTSSVREIVRTTLSPCVPE